MVYRVSRKFLSITVPGFLNVDRMCSKDHTLIEAKLNGAECDICLFEPHRLNFKHINSCPVVVDGQYDVLISCEKPCRVFNLMLGWGAIKAVR